MCLRDVLRGGGRGEARDSVGGVEEADLVRHTPGYGHRQAQHCRCGQLEPHAHKREREKGLMRKECLALESSTASWSLSTSPASKPPPASVCVCVCVCVFVCESEREREYVPATRELNYIKRNIIIIIVHEKILNAHCAGRCHELRVLTVQHVLATLPPHCGQSGPV